MWPVFLLFSCVLLFISKASLRVPGSHGFYRFFAWEIILGLVLLQVPFWFENSFSGYQLLSWSLLVLSLFLVVGGMRLLIQNGKPKTERQDKTLVGLEKTTTLVTGGLYGYIRHPVYGSLLCLAWGAFLKDISLLSFSLVCLATGFLVITARVEERENIRYFGEAYQVYMVHTKMFIPFVF